MKYTTGVTRKIHAVDYGYLMMDGLQVIVTSGASTWRPPIRLASTREIVEITVNFGINNPITPR